MVSNHINLYDLSTNQVRTVSELIMFFTGVNLNGLCYFYQVRAIQEGKSS